MNTPPAVESHECRRLIRYQCNTCRWIDYAYNFSTMTTPFIIECSACGAESEKITWQSRQKHIERVPDNATMILYNHLGEWKTESILKGDYF